MVVSTVAVEYPATIEQAGRIQRVLQAAHQVYFFRRARHQEVVLLQAPYAVLGAHGAATADQRAIGDLVDCMQARLVHGPADPVEVVVPQVPKEQVLGVR